MTVATAPATLPDVRTLTKAHKSALATIRDYKLARVHRGYRAPGSKMVMLSTAKHLLFMRLATTRIIGGKNRIEITTRGRQVLSELEARKR